MLLTWNRIFNLKNCTINFDKSIELEEINQFKKNTDPNVNHIQYKHNKI